MIVIGVLLVTVVGDVLVLVLVVVTVMVVFTDVTIVDVVVVLVNVVDDIPFVVIGVALVVVAINVVTIELKVVIVLVVMTTDVVVVAVVVLLMYVTVVVVIVVLVTYFDVRRDCCDRCNARCIRRDRFCATVFVSSNSVVLVSGSRKNSRRRGCILMAQHNRWYRHGAKNSATGSLSCENVRWMRLRY